MPVHKILSAILLTASLVLSGCASYPSSIAIDQPEQQPQFTEVMASPQQYQGKTLVWGGKIIETRNSNQNTIIEVLQMPLWDSGRPRTDRDYAGGRIHAVVPWFVDPEIYASGRLISVRGAFRGTEPGKIGDHNYDFPILDVTGMELWPKEQAQPQVIYFMDYGYFGPGPAPRSRLFLSTPIPPR